MDIVFAVNARLPTEKAHGLAIMKLCGAFVRAGATVEVLAAQRRGNTAASDAHAFYGIRESFPIRRLACIDLIGIAPIPLSLAFRLEALTWHLSLSAFLLFGSRKRIVYTREVFAVPLLALLGYRVYFECHLIPRRSRAFFMAARRAAGIVVSVQGIREAFLARGLDPARVIVEPSAVDLETFALSTSKDEARGALELPPRAFILVYTGNFTTHDEDKGLADSLKALRLLPADTMLIAVGGNERDIARYSALAAGAGVADRARFIGYRSQAELALYQKAADVLLMPFPDTPHYRTFMTPLKMFEYLAAERPILGTHLPTILEILDEEVAYLVPPGDPDALVREIEAVRAHPQEAARRAKNARARAPRYTWDARVSRIFAFLKRAENPARRVSVALIADPSDPKKPGGLGRCIYELSRHVIAAAPSTTAITVYSRSAFPAAGVAAIPLSGNVWLTGARHLDPNHDLYVFFTPVIPLFFRPKNAIVIVEDLAYLELPRITMRERFFAWLSYRMHRRSLRLARRVVCISEATAAAVERFFGIPASSCAIVPLAAMPLAAPASELPALPREFFLFAGALKDRKNVANIIRAFALFARQDRERDLVLAGKGSGAYYESLIALTHELGVSERVHFLGHVSDGGMAALYARALALVFVSKIEGFGMPVAEAFSAGCPVITANRGALSEVAGEAALLTDPDSPADIARAMLEIARDPALVERLREAGKIRSREFSWEASGKKLVALIGELTRTAS